MDTVTPTPATVGQSAEEQVAACACHLYDAECALHAAHQAGVERWINAAADNLHRAVVDYLAAVAVTQPDSAATEPGSSGVPTQAGQGAA